MRGGGKERGLREAEMKIMKGKRKNEEGYIEKKEQRNTQDVNELKISVRVNLKNLAQQR